MHNLVESLADVEAEHVHRGDTCVELLENV